MKKRVLAGVLAVVLLISSCCVGLYAYAESQTIDVNKELLESLLNDRYWVIETLVDGDRSNNPYAEASMMPTQTLMDEVLENYQTDEAFKALVDAMEIYANTGEYVSGFADSIVTTFMSWFASDTSEGALGAVDDVLASTSELKYESILNDVLQTDYTSSWNQTLYEENMDLEYMKQLGSLLKKLPAYQTAIRDTVGIYGTTDSAIIVYDPTNSDDSDFKIDIETYTNHYLTAYQQDLEAALVNAIDIPGVESDSALEKKILASSYMGLLHAYERVVLPEVEYGLDGLYYDGMFEDTMRILNGAGKVMDIADKTMDYAILLETLQSQKNSTVATMGRIESNTTDKDLAKVLNNYADLVNSQGDDLTLEYEVIANYFRNSQTITNFVTKKVTTGVPKLLEAGVQKFGGVKEVVLHNKISSALSSAGAVVKLAVWVADETTGIKDTAKKIYVLKYLDKIIAEAVNTFNYDLAVYENDKTEENAQAVIDDLEFLKILRLYGEKTAYGSMSAQMESWIGLLLGGGETVEFIKQRYQSSVDTYLGCTAAAFSQNKLALSEGDVLTIMTDTFSNDSEKTYTYAHWKKASGDSVYFAEPEYRLFNGIELNGATLRILKADNGFYLPVVDNDTDGAVIEIYCDNVAFGSIDNSAEMSIYQKKTDVSYEVIDRIVNSGTLNLTGYENSADISVYSLENSSSINITDTQLNLISNIKNTGTITGMVNVCGGDAFYENSYFTMGRQTLSGKGTYSDLTFTSTAKRGVKISGDISVTNSINNPSTRLVTPENIKLTGNCTIVNDYFKYNLGFRDYNSSQSFTLDGAAYIYNDVTFGGTVNFNDSLFLTSDCTTLTLNGDTLVKGDFVYKSGMVAGNGVLSLMGDANITASSPSISYLNFVGNTAQNFSSTNSLTISKLNNTNSSLSGVTFNQKIYVTDTLYSSVNSAYGNGKNVILTGTAKLDGNTINGNVSAENWTCTDSVNIKGNLYTSGDVTVAENVTVNTVNFYQTAGTFILNENSALICSGEYSNKGTVTNNGTISVMDDCVISGAFSAGTLKVKGDISASAELTPETLIFESKLLQNFKNTSATTVENLTVTNTSKSGFTVNSVINVTNCFNDESVNIVNGENIVLSGDAIYVTNGVTKTDLALTGTFTVKSGETLTVNGDLIMGEDTNLIIEDGASVLVKRSVKATSAQIDVAEGASLEIVDYLSSDKDVFNINGNLTVKGDCKMTSSTINADGLIIFKGDLISSSCTWNNPNVSFVSKLQQTVSDSAINVNNLAVDNTSKSGITFKSTVNYYGTYDKGDSVVTGETYIVEK